MLSAYRQLAADREAQGIPALPLNAEQTQALTKLLENPLTAESQELQQMLMHRIPPGVDEAAYIKASWLSSVANGQVTSPLISPLEATKLLGTMVGGYNVSALIEILENENGIQVGEVTSGGFGPTLNKTISIARLKTQYTKSQFKLFALVREKRIAVEIVKLPFVKHNYYRG